MRNLDRVICHLEKLDDDFFGHVIVRVRDGKAVTITDERVTKLDDDQQAQRRWPQEQ